jgi:flagellar biosynthetic protein FlhB
MSQDVGGEKSLPASAQKKQRAREEGNVARSQDLSSALALFAALLGLVMCGGFMFDQIMQAGEHILGEAATLQLKDESLQQIVIQAIYFTAMASAPLMLVMLAAGVISNLGQVGFLFTTKPLAPDLNRLNPITGFGRLFSPRSVVELIKSIAKLSLIAYVVVAYLRDEVYTVILLMNLGPLDMLAPVIELVIGVWWRVAMVMLVLGVADFGYQWWQREQDLRMTMQEAKQEMKEMEGDPHIKRRVRQLQRQMAAQRMIAAVPEADVVITNPTHYAVALRYDAENMNAPIVVAKGMRLVAQKIRDIATEHRVPIVQKPALAREIFRQVEVNAPVPESLFVAVAEVLSFVFRIDKRAAKRRERERMFGRPAARAAG